MYRLMILLVVVPLVLCACAQLAGPCSSSMLDGFMDVEESGLNLATQSYLLVDLSADINGQSFEEGEWMISKKNASGCTVSYRYKLNGQSVTAPIFYVDIETRYIYPEDEMARTMSLVLGEVAPWGPIPDEIRSGSDISIGTPSPVPPSRPAVTARPIVSPTTHPSSTQETGKIQSPEATITPNAANLQLVVINGVIGSGDVETESVRLLNTGTEILMAGWTLDDGEGIAYNFPDFILYSTGAIDVRTRSGNNTTIDLYWGLDQAVWTQGKVIYLRNSNGDLVSSFIVPEN